MADEEQLRSRSAFADLLSPAQVNSIVAGTVHDHDEPAVGSSVKGDAGQESQNHFNRKPLFTYALSITPNFKPVA